MRLCVRGVFFVLICFVFFVGVGVSPSNSEERWNLDECWSVSSSDSVVHTPQSGRSGEEIKEEEGTKAPVFTFSSCSL